MQLGNPMLCTPDSEGQDEYSQYCHSLSLCRSYYCCSA